MAREGSIQYVMCDRALGDITDDHTATTYKRSIKNFAEWARGEGFNKVSKIENQGKVELVQRYERYLETKYRSPSTIHTYLAGVCKGLGVRMDEIDKPKRSAGAIKRSRIDNNNLKGKLEASDPKNAKITEFERAVGIRRDELRRLRGRNLVRDENGHLCVEVERGKGGKHQLQRILPENEEIVRKAFEGVAPDQKVFKSSEVNNKIDFHSLRRECAIKAYDYYAKRLKEEPGYKVELTRELRDRWYAAHTNDRSSYKEWVDDITRGGGKYAIRGENRARAIQNGRPVEYDRLAMMAVSMLHLSHFRCDVTSVNYLTD